MRRPLCLLLILVMLVLSGCWDRIEIMDIASIRMIGIDKAEDGGIRLSLRVTVPTRIKLTNVGGGGGGGDAEGAGGAAHMATLVYAAEGETIMDAMMKMQEMIPRRLFWGHAGPLVISEELAREGVRPVLDFFSRHREPRLKTYIVISQGSAMAFNLAKPAMERIIGESVREIINQRLGVVVDVKDFLMALHTPGQHPVAPTFAVTPSVPGGPNIEVKLTGTAIFREDKMIGWLDDAQSRGLLWLRNEIKTGVVTLDVPTGGKVSMQLIRANTRVRTEFHRGRLRLVVTATTEDDIFESSAPIDFGKGETLLLLQKLLEKDLRERILPVLEQVQHEFRVDVLKFSDAVRRGGPLLWEEQLKERWDEEFPRVPVELRVTAHISRTGAQGTPLWGQTEEVKSTQKKLMQEMGGGR